MLRRLLLAAAGGGSFVVPEPTSLLGYVNGQDGDGVYAIGEFDIVDDVYSENPANPVIEKAGAGWVSAHVKDPWVMPGGLVMFVSGYDGTRYRPGRLTRATTADPWTYESTSTPLFALGGSGDPDEDGVAFLTVLHEPSDATRPWKAWYRGEDSSGKTHVCYAWSPDGTTGSWTKVGAVLDPGPGGTWSDEGVAPAAIFKAGSRYHLMIQGRQGATIPEWQGGEVSFDDPEDPGDYTLAAGNPTQLARFNDGSVSVVPTADVLNGATTVTLANTAIFNIGEPVAIADGDTTAHIGYIASIDSGTQVTLDRPVVGNFTGGGKVFRPFAFLSVVPRTVRRRAGGGYRMWGTAFQPVEDLTQPGSKLWEASFEWTADELDGPWSYRYVGGRGLLLPLADAGAAWHTRSAENPSVIPMP